jgi:hypothetical protein
MVTPDQVAAHAFARDGGGVGRWAAYRRLRKLQQLGLIRRDPTFWRRPQVLRLTRKGCQYAEIGLEPAHLILPEVRHALAVVDLTQQLLAEHPSAELTTERELRVQRRKEMATGQRRPGRGRIPDAVLHMRGKDVAIELDLTPKRSRDIEAILTAYTQEQYDAVWWYVGPGTVERVRKVVKDHRANDYVTVKPWTAAIATSEGSEAAAQ